MFTAIKRTLSTLFVLTIGTIHILLIFFLNGWTYGFNSLDFSNLDKLSVHNVNKSEVNNLWIKEKVVENKDKIFLNYNQYKEIDNIVNIQNIDLTNFHNDEISFYIYLNNNNFVKSKKFYFLFNFSDTYLENAKELTQPYSRSIAINKTNKIMTFYDYEEIKSIGYSNLITENDYFLRFVFGSLKATSNINDYEIRDTIETIAQKPNDLTRMSKIMKSTQDFKFIINSLLYYENEPIIQTFIKNQFKNILDCFFDKYYVYGVDYPNYVGNWWNYDIGIPRRLINILPFLPNYYDKETIKKWVNIVIWYTRQYEHWAGGNLLDYALIRSICFITLDDITSTVDIIDYTINKTFKDWRDVQDNPTTSSFPFYRDGSYLDHDDVPYFGGYGVVLLDGFDKLRQLLKNSVNSINKNENMENFFKMIEVTIMPFMFEGSYSDSLGGRSITRSNYVSSRKNGMNILGLLSNFVDIAPVEYKDRLVNFIFDNLQSDITIEYLDKRLINFLNRYKGKSKISKRNVETTWNEVDLFSNDKEIPFGYDAFENNNRMWFSKNQDRYSIKRNNFMVDIALTSSKTKQFEMMNEENIFGYYFSNGRTLITNKNYKTYDWKYNFGVDPFKIPGTSSVYEFDNQNMTDVEIKKRYDDYMHIDKDKTTGFSNALLLNGYGLINANIENYNKTLWTKKSYVVIDDFILVVGNVDKTEYIDKQSNKKNIYTTIANEQEYSYWKKSSMNLNNSKSIKKFESIKNSFYVLENIDSIVDHHAIREMNNRTMNLTNPSGKTIFEFNELYFDHTKTNDKKFVYLIAPNEFNQEDTIQTLNKLKYEIKDNQILVTYEKDNNTKYGFILTTKNDETINWNGLNLIINNPLSMIIEKKNNEVKMVMSSNENLDKFNIKINNDIDSIMTKDNNEVIYEQLSKSIKVNNILNKFNDINHNSWIKFNIVS